LLAYSVEGARMWYNEASGLITPESVKKSTSDQREALDSIQRWIDECIQRIEGVNTPNDDLRRSYTDWCEQNGEIPKAAVHFGRAMQAKGFEPTKIKMHGLDKRGYKNIGIIYAER
jgi:phage/plasmid-associated DNA primase